MPIQDETQTLASITFQNLFRLYPKLSGMTGTAMTEEAEFGKIYNLPCTEIPTNKEDIRINYPDVIYKTREIKYEKVADEIEKMAKMGRPTLVGTISIEKSEYLSNILKKRGIKHNVLNAKAHQREAYIIAQAGRVNAVTIATNMAGRGTDILLGGNPEYLAKEELDKLGITPDSPNYEEKKEEALARAREITTQEHKKVIDLGGLHVIGTERHESRRIDNQLRGRAARQGDPGSTRFFLSLEDDLMRIFGGDKIAALMSMMNIEEDMAIENPLITRQIESAQRKVETYHFDIRKSVLEYDDVINIQREKFYIQRRKVLASKNLSDDIKYMIELEAEKILKQYISPEMSPAEYVFDDLKMLTSEIHSVFPQLFEIDTRDFKEKRYGEILEFLKDKALEVYKDIEISSVEDFNKIMEKFGAPDEEKQEAFSENNIIRNVERDILLQVIDSKWIDHLNNIDALKDSIGLVAYGQKDPLIEYKKEAFNLFNAMMSEIQSETVRHLFRAKFGVQIYDENSANLADIDLNSIEIPETELSRALKNSTPLYVDENFQTTGIPITRINEDDPCPCGSGQPFKNCCKKYY